MGPCSKRMHAGCRNPDEAQRNPGLAVQQVARIPLTLDAGYTATLLSENQTLTFSFSTTRCTAGRATIRSLNAV